MPYVLMQLNQKLVTIKLKAVSKNIIIIFTTSPPAPLPRRGEIKTQFLEAPLNGIKRKSWGLCIDFCELNLNALLSLIWITPLKTKKTLISESFSEPPIGIEPMTY